MKKKKKRQKEEGEEKDTKRKTRQWRRRRRRSLDSECRKTTSKEETEEGMYRGTDGNGNVVLGLKFFNFFFECVLGFVRSF